AVEVQTEFMRIAGRERHGRLYHHATSAQLQDTGGLVQRHQVAANGDEQIDTRGMAAVGFPDECTHARTPCKAAATGAPRPRASAMVSPPLPYVKRECVRRPEALNSAAGRSPPAPGCGRCDGY